MKTYKYVQHGKKVIVNADSRRDARWETGKEKWSSCNPIEEYRLNSKGKFEFECRLRLDQMA